jgi:hypothetical protein
MVKQFYSLIFFMSFLLICFCGPVWTQAWSPPYRVCWNPGESRGAVIAIDSTNQIHIAWRDSLSGNLEIYYKKTSGFGTAWSPLQRLTWTSDTSAQPFLAVDHSDFIHIVYYQQTTYSTEIFYKRSTNGGSSWSAPKRLTYTSGSTAQPNMVIDSSNTIHLVYLDDTNLQDKSEIFYKYSSDQGLNWSAPQRLTYTYDYSNLPALAIDAGNNLHLVWRDVSPGNWDIFYKYMDSSLKVWTPAKRITWTPEQSNVPDVCADSNNKVHIVWQDRKSGRYELYYKSSPDGGATWSTTQRLTWNHQSNEKPTIVAGFPQTIHLAWYNYVTSTNPDIFYKMSTDGGATWSAVSRLTWTSTGSRYPELALDNTGKPQMVWEEYIINQYDLFYRYKY